jgi:hypothetical protein
MHKKLETKEPPQSVNFIRFLKFACKQKPVPHKIDAAPQQWLKRLKAPNIRSA